MSKPSNDLFSRRRHLLAALAAGGFTALVSTPLGAAEWTKHEDARRGVGVELPSDWGVQKNPDAEGPAFQALSADQNAMVLVFAGTAEELGTADAGELVKTFSNKLTEDSSGVEVVRETVTFDAGGQSGASRILRGAVGGNEGILTFSSVSHEGKVALLMGADKAATDAPSAAFEQIARSLRVVTAAGASEEDRRRMHHLLTEAVGVKGKFGIVFLKQLRKGMSCGQVQEVFPKIDIRTCLGTKRNHTFPEIHIDGHPLISHLRLTMKNGALDSGELHFHTFLDHDLLKEVSLDVYSAKWGRVSPEKRDKDIIIWRDAHRHSVSRSFTVNHWKLDVELP